MVGKWATKARELWEDEAAAEEMETKGQIKGYLGERPTADYKSVVQPRGQDFSKVLSKAFTFSMYKADWALQPCWGKGRDA